MFTTYLLPDKSQKYPAKPQEEEEKEEEDILKVMDFVLLLNLG